ncbi:PspC domain-containing protein [Schaalia sp. 19OD2882]|nr:ATP-binding protein [Schaalia sp. 19OD2882]QWW20599.1 PspC domain-containing protein [Schaalia sp. 19OD2882]
MATPWAAGVCAGLARHLGVSATWIRGAFVVTGLALGISVLLYLWLWIMVPADRYEERRAEAGLLGAGLRTRDSERERITERNRLLTAGVAALVLAALLFALLRLSAGNQRDILSAVLLVFGILLVWSQAGRALDMKSPDFVASVAAGLISVLGGLALLVFGGDPADALLRGGVVGGVLIGGMMVAVMPLWLRASRERNASRVQQVRDAERAEIAAHLHDSVLQTLTLIRAGAEEPSRVRALALAQERELRAWLYTGRHEAATSLAQALREALDQVESTHGVPVELVTVGDVEPGPAELALVAATAEAAKNAVRHGAPPVTVYVEARHGAVDAYVKDRGPGFDIATIPEDRHGVRGSIIGRMGRAGGCATIRRLDPGTEVHLSLAAPGRAESAPGAAPTAYSSPVGSASFGPAPTGGAPAHQKPPVATQEV